MTREIILQEFTNDIKKFKQLAKNIAGAQDADDLFQMCALMLWEFPEDRLISYYNPAQGLKPIFLRMLVNQYKSTTSKFHKLYRREDEMLQKKTEDIILNSPQSEEEPSDLYFQSIKAACESIYNNAPSPEVAALEKMVWELYVEMGSLRKAQSSLPLEYGFLALKDIHEVVKKFQYTIKEKIASSDY